MLIVGSFALKLQGIDLGRECSDVDVICTQEELIDTVKRLIDNGCNVTEMSMNVTSLGTIRVVKYTETDGTKRIIDASIVDDNDTIAPLGSNKDIYMWPATYANFKYYNVFDRVVPVAAPDTVLMMKLSHRYKKDSVHFDKTMQDIQKLRSIGITLDDYLKKVQDAREKLTLAPIQKNYKLNVDKERFFTDNVPYQYDHDDLHVAVTILDKPAYNYYLADNAQVMCSKEKFFGLPEYIRMCGVLEECYVLALERAVIPHGVDPDKAFRMALKKVCTSITSGWFREYAWENYDDVIAYHELLAQMYGANHWVKHYEKNLAEGKIKLYETKQTKGN
jgi:hypothetical protein